jgi:hypothetical protein
MDAYNYQTRRYVLRPGVTAEEVDEFSLARDWELVREIARDRDAGVDGQLIWQGPSDVSLHYIVDAMSGVGYIVLAGQDEGSVAPFAREAVEHLDPWKLEELFQAFDGADDARSQAQNALRIGLAAGPEFDDGVFRRISDTYADEEPKVRYAGLWAATYTGYPQFVPPIAEVADNDQEEWVRSRAADILTAFESGDDTP